MVSRSERAGMLAGAAFPLVLFLGVNLMLGSTPDVKSKDSAATVAQKWVAVVHSHDRRVKILIGGLVVALAAMALIWFANTLRNRFAAHGTPIMAFATLAAAGVLGTVVGPTALVGGYIFGQEPLPTDGSAMWAVADTAMPMMLIVYGVAVAAMLATFAVAARAALPRWLLVLTWIISVASLASVLWFPMLATLIYFLVLGIWGGVRGGRSEAIVPSAAAAAPA